MKRIVHILLILTFIATLSLVIVLQQASLTGHVVARGGYITEVSLESEPPYGGIYGTLSETGATTIEVTQGDVTQHTIYRANSNCSTASLIAGQGTLGTINPISPQTADAVYGNDPLNGISFTQMYTLQEDFVLQGRQITLAATTTQGRLGDYIQAIAASGSDIIFVTKVKRFGQAYNGDQATYQFVLDPGTWRFTIDETEACKDFDNFTFPVQEQQPTQLVLRSVVPFRVCTNIENTFYAAYGPERVQCRPSDIPDGCYPASGARLTLVESGQDVISLNTEDDGSGLFTIADPGRYTLEASYEGETTRQAFRAELCTEDSITQLSGSRIIETEADDVSLSTIFAEDPRQEDPEALDPVGATYVLVILLSIATIVGAGIVYGRTHADSSVYVLEFRIWWQKLKRKLL